MNKDKIIPTHNGLERIRTYTIEEVFKWIDDNPRKTYWEDGEYRIKMTRAKIFKKKGLICSTCGLEGLYFILEKDKGGGIHLDLYGLENEVEILIQVLGKPKAKIMMSPDITQEEMKNIALDNPKITEVIKGKTVRKVICVPGRLVNIVAN